MRVIIADDHLRLDDTIIADPILAMQTLQTIISPREQIAYEGNRRKRGRIVRLVCHVRRPNRNDDRGFGTHVPACAVQVLEIGYVL